MSQVQNSFFLYCQANRNKVKDDNPNLPNSDISSILGEQWRSLSEDDKKPYKDRAQLNRNVIPISSFVIFRNILIIL